MPVPNYDNMPDPISADAVDVLGAGKSADLLFDPVLGKLRVMSTADLTAVQLQAGQGAVLGQSTGTIDATPRQLTGIPAGSGYARLQFHSAGVYARYDGTAASGSALEEQYAAGGLLELTSAADIANFRYVTLSGAGTFSVLYRSF